MWGRAPYGSWASFTALRGFAPTLPMVATLGAPKAHGAMHLLKHAALSAPLVNCQDKASNGAE